MTTRPATATLVLSPSNSASLWAVGYVKHLMNGGMPPIAVHQLHVSANVGESLRRHRGDSGFALLRPGACNQKDLVGATVYSRWKRSVRDDSSISARMLMPDLRYFFMRVLVKPGSPSLTHRSVEWFRSRQSVPQDNDIFAQRFLPWPHLVHRE